MARLTHMYLITWIFQGFFAISLIAMVVIFQEDLRGVFERLALWSLRRKDITPEGPMSVDIVVRCAAIFSRERIGALIVLKGNAPIDRYVTGGKELDGVISQPLIESLFDPHSKGHDGALLIEGNRVSQFGAHLPLSNAFEKLEHVGTRHAAALGLAERTDALCIVVSEENGKISVAYRGDLVRVENLDELERRVVEFLEGISPSKRRSLRTFLMPSRLPQKGLAVLFAVALWFVFVQGFKPAEQRFEIPVVIEHLPEDLQIKSIQPERVQINLAGLIRDFRSLDESRLRLRLNLKEAGPGQRRFRISEKLLTIPPTLRLISTQPTRVEVDLARMPTVFVVQPRDTLSYQVKTASPTGPSPAPEE